VTGIIIIYTDIIEQYYYLIILFIFIIIVIITLRLTDCYSLKCNRQDFEKNIIVNIFAVEMLV